MTNKATRWFHDYGTDLYSRTGTLKEDGHFEYQGTFGICLRMPWAHFATKNEAILDAIKEVDSLIEGLNKKKQSWLDKMDKEG
jgi:hypothetical protein